MSRRATAAIVALGALSVGAAPAEGPISWAQAKCMMEGRKIAVLGDSNSRYWFYTFNVFLDTGELRDGSYGKWGDGGPPDYDAGEKGNFWTGPYGRSTKGDHLMNMKKTFRDIDASSEFWFIQTTWFDGDEQPDRDNMADVAKTIEGWDLVVVSSHWWDLKPWGEDDRGYVDCGDDWTSSCARAYEKDVEKVVKEMLKPAKAGVWRDASCCGDNKNTWPETIEKMNDVAAEVADDGNVGYAKVFDMFDADELDDATVDGTHPYPEYYHRWTMKVLEEAEKQLNTGCLDGGGGGDEDEEEEDEEEEPSESTRRPQRQPTQRPSRGATAQPTRRPTKKPTQRPTPRPTREPTFKPTRKPVIPPTERPTPLPTYPVCENDLGWHKRGDPEKDCAWAAALENRCVVKGEDGRWAFEACRESCDTCLGENPCPATGDDDSDWIHASGAATKDCAWVAGFSGNRCAQPGADGSFAFRGCPVACRTCGYDCGQDDPGWFKAGNQNARDCDWVAAAAGVRCSVIGQDGSLAFESCPKACRACGGAFGTCADDDEWSKNNDPDKDCAWIASVPPGGVRSQRCVAKGADKAFAFLSCPEACDAC